MSKEIFIDFRIVAWEFLDIDIFFDFIFAINDFDITEVSIFIDFLSTGNEADIDIEIVAKHDSASILSGFESDKSIAINNMERPTIIHGFFIEEGIFTISEYDNVDGGIVE